MVKAVPDLVGSVRDPGVGGGGVVGMGLAGSSVGGGAAASSICLDS